MKNKRAVDPNAREAFKQVKLEIAEDFGIAEQDVNLGNVDKSKSNKQKERQSHRKK